MTTTQISSSSPHTPQDRRRPHGRLIAAVTTVLVLTCATVAAAVGPEAVRALRDMVTGTLSSGSEPHPMGATDQQASDGGGTDEVIHQVNTDDRVIFVTIDDGHYPSPRALDLVREHQMPVSLFLNAEPVRLHASYFEEYVTLGNRVHSHTMNHPDLRQLTPTGQEEEICGMVEMLQENFDPSAIGSLLRAPYGASDEGTTEAAAACGTTAVVHWSGTAEDGHVSLAHGDELLPGDIILTHFTDDLPANLEQIQRMADEAGFTIARLEDYL
ncbi:polysaccharide deacetylase family protein [Ruania rhizosphaerae]|uniref:polysaccharide deacetylase family protein n=1 Tax=Ruania rhizosphaerae TaxID=1840413 RepID=UPI001F36D6BB|nr:polysaccharide deacetylase family protein [Ruania rhizosphaerae]